MLKYHSTLLICGKALEVLSRFFRIPELIYIGYLFVMIIFFFE